MTHLLCCVCLCVLSISNTSRTGKRIFVKCDIAKFFFVIYRVISDLVEIGENNGRYMKVPYVSTFILRTIVYTVTEMKIIQNTGHSETERRSSCQTLFPISISSTSQFISRSGTNAPQLLCYA
jgi:hypothetical protein